MHRFRTKKLGRQAVPVLLKFPAVSVRSRDSRRSTGHGRSFPATDRARRVDLREDDFHITPLVLVLVPCLGGASFRSTNFIVDAQSREVAQRVAERAESYRVTIARAWLGHEIPDWERPCPIKVRLTAGEAGGVTSFGFHQGRVTDQTMTVEGRLDRILASALPHEITHTVFAAFFGCPMPRWADEGASLLSEDQRELVAP